MFLILSVQKAHIGLETGIPEGLDAADAGEKETSGAESILGKEDDCVPVESVCFVEGSL